MHDALGEEQELRDARLRAINRNMDVQDIEQQVHEQIVAARENVENVGRALANLDKDENSLEGKIEKRRAELERAEKRLSTLESVRPAYMDEYERLQEGLQDLYAARTWSGIATSPTSNPNWTRTARRKTSGLGNGTRRCRRCSDD